MKKIVSHANDEFRVMYALVSYCSDCLVQSMSLQFIKSNYKRNLRFSDKKNNITHRKLNVYE